MNIWSKIKEFFSARKMNDDGAGSISLMVVSLAVTIMAGMVATSATMSLATTYDQLSQREADASVEVALNDAVGRYTAGNCLTAINTSPEGWRWQIFKTANEEMPLSSTENNVYSGCPTKDDKWVLIVATGKGRDNTFSTKTAVYKTYGDGSGVVPQAITGNGVNLRNSNVQQSNGVSGSNGTLYTAGSDRLYCVDSEIQINVVSGSGTPANSLTRCPIYGDFNSERTSYFGTDSYLYGDICSTVNVTDASSKMIKGTFKENNTVDCAPKIKGTFYGYLPDPRDAVKFSGAQCNNWSTFSAAVMNMTGDKNMVDLRGCSSSDLSKTINSTGNKTIALKGNVTILLNDGVNAQKIAVSSADGKPYTLSFASPSAVSNSSESTCGTSGSNNTFSNISYENGISGMFYSACGLTVNNSTISGQVYAGGTLNMSSSKLNYSLVELPYAFRPVADIGKAQQLTRVY